MRQVVDRPDPARHIENRRRRRALLTVHSIPALASMVLADVVFTAKGALKVPCAFVERSTLRTAAFPVMHADSHRSLAFPYAQKRTMKVNDCKHHW